MTLPRRPAHSSTRSMPSGCPGLFRGCSVRMDAQRTGTLQAGVWQVVR